MVKNLEELISEAYSKSRILGKLQDDEILELLKLVRNQTLIEAANKADADYFIIRLKENTKLEDNIEVYVLKESILELDKNSIEL